MTTIQVKCVDQNLQILNSPLVASGGLQETAMQFDFCSKWDGLTKTAIFYRDKSEVYSVVLDLENKCMIPDEVMQEAGRFYFGVFGINEIKRKTTFIMRYDIVEGAFFDELVESEPTSSIYEQILAKYSEVIPYVEQMADEWGTAKEELEQTKTDFINQMNETKGYAETKLAEAKTYSDGKLAEANAHTNTAINGLSNTYVQKSKITFANGVLTIDLD